MWISQLTVHNCRIIDTAQLALCPHANVIVGDNGSGKSSMLEALSILARGRSFRTTRIQDVIRYEQQALMVNAKIENGEFHHTYPVGIQKSAKETHIRLNYASVTQQSILTSHIPLTLIHPNSVDLVSGAPSERRAFLDWIAFYRFPEFQSVWRTYQRVLRQRNACLRESSQHHALEQWNVQFVRLQPSLYRFRQWALEALIIALEKKKNILDIIGLVSFELTTGYPQGVDIFDVDAVYDFLQQRQSNELKQGFSLYGTHRSDMHISVNGYPAVRVASRGQLKLLAMVLLFAQSEVGSEQLQKRGIIAIDDLASELDESNQCALYNLLATTQQQLVITSTQPNRFLETEGNGRLFHIHNGHVKVV